MNTHVMPQDMMAEKAVLGSIFIRPEAILEASEIISERDFLTLKHRQIFRAMLDIFDRGEAIDPVTVKDELSRQNTLESVGGLSYIVEVLNSTPTSENIKYYAEIVREKARLRQVIADMSKVTDSAFAGDVKASELVAQAEQALASADFADEGAGPRHIRDILAETNERIDARALNNNPVTGLETGFADFDKLTAGLHDDNLIILAARPAVGKTAFALNIAQHVALKVKKPVLFFSLEMGAEELSERLIASVALVPSYHLRTGQLTAKEWEQSFYAQGQLDEASLVVDDTPAIKITEIRSRARKLAQEMGGLGLIMIDYLQLITGARSENRQQEVSGISRQLKVLAKELNVPVVALSQLSRGVTQRQDKRPLLSDLRESGSIEQDADLVAFLHREDYYSTDADASENNTIELILAKNRHGALGTVKLYFHKEFAHFSSLKEEVG